MNNEKKYHPALRFLHWIMGIAIILMICVGYFMTSVEVKDFPKKFEIYGYHKAVGVILLCLALIRLLVRNTTTIPKYEFKFAWWEAGLSWVTHRLLYLFMILIPLSGVLGSMYGGFPIMLFSYQIPMLVEKNQEISKIMWKTHEYGIYALIGLLIMHVGAVVKHLLIDKRNILPRIL